ncbi:hypothetical protein [Spirosoma jeollabukense]
MKMNTKPIVNLEVSLKELTDAFAQLPNNPDDQQQHYAVRFPVTDDYGNTSERQLLFSWNHHYNDWEINTKGHDLLITASSR